MAHGMRYQVISAPSTAAHIHWWLRVFSSDSAVQNHPERSAHATSFPCCCCSLQARTLAAIPAEQDVSRWMAGTTALREDNEVAIAEHAHTHMCCIRHSCGVSRGPCRALQLLDADVTVVSQCHACETTSRLVQARAACDRLVSASCVEQPRVLCPQARCCSVMQTVTRCAGS